MKWFNIFKFIKKRKKKNQMLLEIKRFTSDNEGTFGVMYTKGFGCFTLELPYKNNKPFISCIPPGLYNAAVDDSIKIGNNNVIRFDDAQFNGKRYGILIHVGNFAGDKEFEYKSDVQGCICVGFEMGELNNQKAILNSNEAMFELIKLTEKEHSISITIEDIYN